MKTGFYRRLRSGAFGVAVHGTAQPGEAIEVTKASGAVQVVYACRVLGVSSAGNALVTFSRKAPGERRSPYARLAERAATFSSVTAVD